MYHIDNSALPSWQRRGLVRRLFVDGTDLERVQAAATTIIGGPQVIPGPIGRGHKFGSGQEATATWPFTAAQTFTVMGWATVPNEASPTNYGAMWSLENTIGTPYIFQIYMDQPTGGAAFYALQGNLAPQILIGSNVYDGRPHHYAMVGDPVNVTCRCYLDGVYQGTLSPGTFQAPSGASIRVNANSGGTYVTPLVNDLRVYDRAVDDPAGTNDPREIALIYAWRPKRRQFLYPAAVIAPSFNAAWNAAANTVISSGARMQ